MTDIGVPAGGGAWPARILLVVSALAVATLAQMAAATISGQVLDVSAAPVADATITVRNQTTAATRKAATGADGHFTVPALGAGLYSARAEKAAFASVRQTGIVLALGESVELKLVLPPATLRQEVTVAAQETAAVGLGTAHASTVIRGQSIRALPLNGRSFDQLLTLVPGVADFTGQKTGGVGVSNASVGNLFAVNGNTPEQNLFLLNGIEFTGAGEVSTEPGGTSGELLGAGAVEAVNVLAGDYGAQYGQRPGAQVSIVTRGGGNQWHGSGYEFFRSRALDARDYFAAGPKPGLSRHQFGATLGGPLRKDHGFLFLNYEQFRQRRNLSDVTLVPDAAARAGSLPAGNGPMTAVGVAPAAAPLLTLWPAPNGPELGGGIAEAMSSPLQTIRDNFYNARWDNDLSNRDRWSTIYTADFSGDVTPTANPLSLDLENMHEQVLGLEETHVYSSASLLTSRVGFSRAAYFYTGESAVALPGFIQGDPIGAVVVGGSASPNSASSISLAGSNAGSNLWMNRNLFTFVQDLDLVRGKQTITAGWWMQRVQSNENLALTQYGQATFASLADLLQGNVSVFQAVPDPTPLGWRSLEGALYAQDAVRLRPSLLLTLGVRIESTDGWNEVFGRASNYLSGPTGAIETQPRIGRSVFTRNRAAFLPEPRMGLAWAPRSGSVVRAGFGVYDDLQDALGYRLDQNAPFNASFSLTNLPLANLPLARGKGLPPRARIAPAGVQPTLATPRVASYTLRWEQQLTPDMALNLAYVGSRGAHEILGEDVNMPAAVNCPTAPCPAALASGTSYIAPGSPLANPALANSWTWMSAGSSNTNALQADVEGRLRGGVWLRGAYAWSKTLDDGDSLNPSVAANAPGLVMDPADIRRDWGPATFNLAQSATIEARAPLGGRRLAASPALNRVLGGWRLDALATLHTGFPFTPEMSFNPSNNGDTRNNVRPSINPSFQGPVIVGTPRQWFNPAAFMVPANGTYGDLGRNTLAGPGLVTIDASVQKQIPLREGTELELRAEFYNLLNHPNFGTPGLITFHSATGAPVTSAGVVTTTSTAARQIQLGVKLDW